MNRKTVTAAIALIWVSSSFAQMPSDRKLSLTLDNVPIVTALNMIAKQNGLNLVISGEVAGSVSVRLQDVDVATALDAVLTANGYNYFLKDNVIIVKSVSTDAAGEFESRVVTLKYISPVTAEKAVTAIMSTKGHVTILDRSAQNETGQNSYHANRIVITDYPSMISRSVEVIEQIDIPERSIMIEARIIETTIDSKSDIGLSWPTAVGARLSDDDNSATTTTTDQWHSAGVYEPQNGNWAWGKLSVGEVSLILNALQQNGNSRLVSDPRITTLENHEAVFKFETIIPIQTINRFTEGAATSDIVTYEDKEVGISLRVLPRINEGGTITLDVEPRVEDILRMIGPAGNQKPETASRTIQTRVTVNNGETVALGGLLKENETESIQRVPLLGHIPLIGRWLFSSKTTEKSTTDLLILITPHLLQ
jgi:type IV pilus secretin PilQ/predicted competence protein